MVRAYTSNRSAMEEGFLAQGDGTLGVELIHVISIAVRRGYWKSTFPTLITKQKFGCKQCKLNDIHESLTTSRMGRTEPVLASG